MVGSPEVATSKAEVHAAVNLEEVQVSLGSEKAENKVETKPEAEAIQTAAQEKEMVNPDGAPPQPAAEAIAINSENLSIQAEQV